MTIIKLLIVALALIWMQDRDREHIEEIDTMARVIFTQARVIEGMECGPTIEMSMPIGAMPNDA